MDLAILTSQPESVRLVGGETVLVRPLTMNEWGALQAWFKRACPSPVTRALLGYQQALDFGGSISAEARESLFDHAQRESLNWPPRVGSVTWFDAIVKAEGALAQFLHAVLIAADPSVTPARCEALASRFEVEDMRELLRVALHGENPSAPKARRPTATAPVPSDPIPTSLAS